MAAVASSVPSRYSWERDVPRTAGLGRRAAAFAADAVVIVVVTYVATFILSGMGLLTLPKVSLEGGLGDENLGFLWLTTLLELPVNLAYFTLMEGLTGRSLGKLLLGLRVVKVTGEPVSVFEAFLRALLRLLWLTPVGLAFVVIDLYLIQTGELEQRIGDRAAGTVVVHDAR